MKKTIMTAALCLMAMSSVFAQQTKRIMTVTQKDGTEVKYKVSDVERVSFSSVELATLKNQWAYGSDVEAVSRVTLLETDDNNVFDIYGDDDEKPALSITMPKSLMGSSVTLGSEEADGVKVTYNGEQPKLKGTVQAKFDKFKKNITIALAAETAELTDLRCQYTGVYNVTYNATNTIGVTNVGNTATYNVASAFSMKPATVGAATTFAFGDVEATTAEGLLDGKVAVQIGVTASKLYNGTIDMATDAASYTFKYIDYATRTVYTNVKSGTLTTAQGSDGKVYVKMHATLDDNREIDLDFFGATTDVESLDGMIPSAVSDKGYKYYNADGGVAKDKTIGMALLDEYKGNYTFYMYDEAETSKYGSEKVVLKVGSAVINGGTLNLGELAQDVVFDLKYNPGGIQLQSYAVAGKYGNQPLEGTLSVSKSDDGTYDIMLDVVNSYTNNNTSKGGDNTRLLLHYKGTFGTY